MKMRNCSWFSVRLNKPIIDQSSKGFWGHVGRIAVNLPPVLGGLVEIRMGIEVVANRSIMQQRGEQHVFCKWNLFLMSLWKF